MLVVVVVVVAAAAATGGGAHRVPAPPILFLRVHNSKTPLD